MNQIECALIQNSIIWQSPKDNLDFYTSSLSDVHVDLIILPEMFNTGFTNHVEDVAETMDGPTVSWMKEVSNQKKSAVCGSLIIAENGQYYNRFIWAADDIIQHYDKRHLFTAGGEDKRFTAGQSQSLITWRNWNILPIICYDLRFPVWCRNTLNYDMLICVANWPVPRIHHWDQLLLARAIENQSFVVACNRVGQDRNGWTFNGHSAAINPIGQYILPPSEEQNILTFSLDKSQIKEMRKDYPFLKDQDMFRLE